MGKTSVFSDAAWYLDEWAKWAKSGSGVCKGYPRKPSFANAISATIAGCMISDEDAQEIDSLVSCLRVRDESTWAVLHTYYRSGSSLSHTAKKVGVNMMQAKVLLEAGTAWIESKLSDEMRSKII